MKTQNEAETSARDGDRTKVRETIQKHRIQERVHRSVLGNRVGVERRCGFSHFRGRATISKRWRRRVHEKREAGVGHTFADDGKNFMNKGV